jgi:general secretion pathway protein G
MDGEEPRGQAMKPVFRDCLSSRDRRSPLWSGHGRATSRLRSDAGFTLLEIIFAVAVLAIIGMIAHGQFAGYVERSKIAVAKADIVTMTVDVIRYQSNHDGRLPETLADIGRAELPDPWQRPYHYVNLTGESKGKARKDHRLNPINSDYDLFSAGKDGVYKPQISQKDSLDDVIRARDGAYIGVAEEF